MIDIDDEQIKKALVSLAIEQTLLEIGTPTLEKVINKLFEDYHCYVPDCYRHPEYLAKVLKEIFGESYNTIVKSIGKRLEEFALQEPIRNFLEKISE